MTPRPARFRALYGAGPLHLLITLAAIALAAYTLGVIGLSALWNPDVWWQSIAVWFLGAVIAHDLVLFPLYALADRSTQRALRTDASPGSEQRPLVPPLNYLRVPALAVGLLFLLFFPGIIGQGADTYLKATGQTQDPFLQRWLLLSATIFALSAIVYAARLLTATRSHSSSSDVAATTTSGAEQPTKPD